MGDSLGPSSMNEQPLSGRRVVVTRGGEQAQRLIERFAGLGAEVIHLPAISIVDPPSWDEVDWSIKKLAEGFYSWVLFTSSNGVEKLFERIGVAGKDARAFGRSRLGAVGTATAEALGARGLKPDLMPDEFTGVALATALGRGTGRVLLPRPVDAPPDAVHVLTSNGWKCEEVTCYQTIAPDRDSASSVRVRAGEFDIVTFASGSAIQGFVDIAGPIHLLKMSEGDEPGPLIACIGPSTATVAAEVGMRVDVVAEPHTSEGLVTAVTEALSPETS